MRKIASLSIICFLVLGGLLGILLSQSQNVKALTWTIQTVDANGEDVGDYASHVLDSMGRPHIAYQYIDHIGQPNRYGLRHAWWDGVKWNVEMVDGNAGYPVTTSIAVDSLDRPHISYTDDGDRDLKYASWTGSMWQVITIDSVGDVGLWSSLIIDSLDRPHISYYDTTNHALKYAWFDGTQWKIERVDDAGPWACATSLALDSQMRPHIAYIGGNGTAIRYAWWTGTAWGNGTVESSNPGQHVDTRISLKLDSFENPHVLYTLNYMLRYAVWNGSAWDIQTLDSPYQHYGNVSLFLDAADIPHIATDRWDTGLYYGYWTGSTWSIEAVDLALNNGRCNSIIITRSGNVSIAYHNDGLGTLKYAHGPCDTPPEASFTVSPAYGNITTNFQFDASASSDLEDPGASLQVRWDWENDGTWDTGWSTSKTASRQFTSLGMHYVRLQVKDTVGLTDWTVRSLWINNTPPVASFIITPSHGNVTTAFSFDASGSSDLEDPPAALEVRWDWEDDGSYDTLYSLTKTAVHSYASQGTFTIRLSVRDSDGLTNKTVRQVLVQEPPDYLPANPHPSTLPTIGLSKALDLSVDVRNVGGPANQTAVVAFYNDSTPSSPFWTFPLPPISAGGTSAPFTATWISPAVPGVYRVTADVDYNNQVPESNETNNTYTWSITVIAGPITSLVIGQPNYTSTATYITSSTPLDFSVKDRGGTGILNTTYRIDGGEWRNYTATGRFFLAGEGKHTVEWYSVDNAGNVEGISSKSLSVDDTPPATTIDPADHEATTDTRFTLTATDGGSGVRVTRYRIDGGDWTDYSGFFTLSEGLHNVSYFSIDNLGNREAERYLPVDVRGPPQPPSVEANYKPLVAATFAIILAVVGLWSSRKRPWKGGMAVAKAFIFISMPFVIAEAMTGIVSLLTGMLSMPPLVGIGLAVDLAILLTGLTIAVARMTSRGTSEDGAQTH